MKFTLFLTHYFAWHYGRGVASFLAIWRDFVWFAYHFFSIPVLLRTLFAPFQKLNEEYKRTLDLGAIASTLIVNVVMRLVGAVARTFVIFMGTLAIFFVIAAGAVLFAAWVILPLAAFTFLVLGINGLASA